MLTPYYQDAAVTLYLGDCREILPQIEQVDHAMTDPPYGVDVYLRMRKPDSSGSDGGKVGARRIKKGDSIQAMRAGDIGSLADLAEPISEQLARLTRRWCIVFSDAESIEDWRIPLKNAGMRYVRTGAWVKPDAMPQMTGDRPSVGFEPCTICHAHGPMRWNGGGRQALWTHNTAKGDARPDHPCPKPLPLMRDLVLDFTDPGDLILDPFAGSGTTLRAAKMLGRRAIGIEASEEFAAVAAEWLARTELDERYVRIPGKRGKQGAMDFGATA